MEGKYANIIIDIAHESVDRTFQYKIPERMFGEISVGQEVLVPFGKGNRRRKGYVIEVTDHAEYDVDKLKELAGISKDSVAIEGQLIALAAWIRKTYGSTMIQALKTVLPVKDKMQSLNKRYLCLSIGKAEARQHLGDYQRKHHQAKARLLEALIDEPVLEEQAVRRQLNIAAATVQALVKDGVIATQTSRTYRNPVEEAGQGEQHLLTELQQSVVQQVQEVFHQKEKKPFLLHGITGSGKTEVYVELVAQAAKEGRSSIVLIPEIALTRQTVQRFYSRFGDRVSILHSRLSKGERFDQFERAKKGDIDVMIGPRSALFTPFSNLGYIIVDEEHETSYKSEYVPKYHAREVAVQRGKMAGATVLLASATPSVDSYFLARRGDYQLLEMKERISKSGLAHVFVVDMREELRHGNRSIFSSRLSGEMEKRLERKEQTLLFLNRRGYHGFISCRSCGQAVKCPNCDVTLSVHANGRMVCHYCGFEQEKVSECPACGSPYIGGFRVGTEQVEELVKKQFPQARVLRMDMDTTRGRHGHEQIVEAFLNQKADILIGTQMIVKGHDFPNVTLVGILAADMSLQMSDFRSAERTFQLLTQAAGRAGRGKLAGEVIIQSYDPQHYSIQLSKEQNYEAFYEEEMKFRRIMGYPPAGHVLEIFVSAETEQAAKEGIQNIFLQLQKHFRKYIQLQQLTMVGPASAAIGKLNSRYRQVLYLKSTQRSFLEYCRQWLEEQEQADQGLQVQYDITL